MTYENLIVERRGHVARVTLHRPDKANALSYQHLAEIEDVALSFREDAETRVVVFTGAGKHFSSGADLGDPEGSRHQPMVLRRRRMRIGERAIRALYGMDQITIAAWNGAAIGGGACIVTALDFRVGADDCFIQYPEIDLGVNLMWKSLPLCVHLVGPARAKRLVAGGERVHAETLLQWGMLDRLVPRAELLDQAFEMAAIYAEKPPMAIQMIKQSVNAIASSLDQAVMHMDADQNLLSTTSEDHGAAVRAYLGKKKPRFTGN